MHSAFRLAMNFSVAAGCALILFCASPAPVAGKAILNEQDFKSLFQVFAEVEEDFEEGRWDAALERCAELQSHFNRLVPVLGDSVESETIYHFGYSMGKFQIHLGNRDLEECEESFMELQGVIFQVLSDFAFDVPPTLMEINRSLIEAENSLRENNLQNVVHEMREIGRAFRYLHKNLKTEGVDTIDMVRYHRQINQVMAASESGNMGVTRRNLNELKKLTYGFLAIFAASEEL